MTHTPIHTYGYVFNSIKHLKRFITRVKSLFQPYSRTHSIIFNNLFAISSESKIFVCRQNFHEFLIYALHTFDVFHSQFPLSSRDLFRCFSQPRRTHSREQRVALSYDFFSLIFVIQIFFYGGNFAYCAKNFLLTSDWLGKKYLRNESFYVALMMRAWGIAACDQWVRKFLIFWKLFISVCRKIYELAISKAFWKRSKTF